MLLYLRVSAMSDVQLGSGVFVLRCFICVPRRCCHLQSGFSIKGLLCHLLAPFLTSLTSLNFQNYIIITAETEDITNTMEANFEKYTEWQKIGDLKAKEGFLVGIIGEHGMYYVNQHCSTLADLRSSGMTGHQQQRYVRSLAIMQRIGRGPALWLYTCGHGVYDTDWRAFRKEEFVAWWEGMKAQIDDDVYEFLLQRAQESRIEELLKRAVVSSPGPTSPIEVLLHQIDFVMRYPGAAKFDSTNRTEESVMNHTQIIRLKKAGDLRIGGSVADVDDYGRTLLEIHSIGGWRAFILCTFLFTPQELYDIEFDSERFEGWWKIHPMPGSLKGCMDRAMDATLLREIDKFIKDLGDFTGETG